MVLRLYPGEREKLQQILIKMGGTQNSSNIVLEGVIVSLYQKKAVINNADFDFGRHIVMQLTPIRPHAGSDEAGKGDLFGPLVVAATYLDDQLAMRLAIDSKELSNIAVKNLARFFVENAKVVVVKKEPYELKDNMNKILLSLHTQVKKVMSSTKPFYVDDFGARESLRNEGMIPLVRGEVIPAVAAASIVARATFLEWLESNNLPAGSSIETQKVARQIYEEQGCPKLERVAKANFSLTRKLCPGEQNFF
jgi:ribonuclease HIII